MSKPHNQNSQRQQQDRRLFRIFNYYRVLLSLTLLFTYSNEVGKVFIGLEYPLLFIATTLVYTAINIALALVLLSDQPLQPQQIALNILIDILALSLLTYANGGVGSGFGILIILSIAAGSILMRGRHAVLFAAISSIAMLALESYRASTDALTPNYFQAGVLGMVFFATALFVKRISLRIDASEDLATQRASDIAHLEKLNRLIIQRMRTGIIVCNQDGDVHMMNEAAIFLLSQQHQEDDPTSTEINQLTTPLMQRLIEWRQNPQRRTSPFQTSPETPPIQANFTAFMQDGSTDVLIFLEDNTKAIQQAQQLKLASLGQLTASIAHEIRNPLGAISHAAQLLDESENLDEADRRLTHIVQAHSRRMNSTIENILELSRRRPSSPEPILLAPWLKAFAASFNEDQRNAGEFIIQVSPADMEVHFDPSQLEQVLTNLSRNGLLYSQTKTGRAVLYFNAGIRADNELPYLDIIDEGPGITPEALPHLFEPFYTTERSGTGLGLYISRELCQANNARLDHIANQTGGCCFRIIFPHPKQITA